jgi:endonuclease/exonuclease/phosphatase family metal-dependent hydrolase
MSNRLRQRPGEAPAEPTPARRRPSAWHLPLWWANLAAVLVLLLCYLSIHVSPVTFWPLAFVGMVYPYALLVNMLFIGWWALFRRKRILPSVLAILLGWSHVGEYVQLFGRSSGPDNASEGVKVMSYNVRLFDLYNWTHNKETRDRIFAMLHREDPSILCMQEFYAHEAGGTEGFVTKDSLLANWKFTDCHDVYPARSKYGHLMGIATFSAYPIVKKGVIHFPDDLNNLCLWTDLRIGTDTIRVYNAHLASIRFGDADYRFMKELDTDTDRDSLARGGSRIIGRLKNAFIRRTTEVQLIAKHMRKSPHPLLYCGDLNDTPMSWGYHHLRDQGLNDAFVGSGSGIGHTYIGDFPSFRIDHLLHSEAIRTWDFHTVPDKLSDHRAITCRMDVAKE